MPKVFLNGLNIYYREDGVDPPAFLLFNGAGLTTRFWGEVAEGLAKNGRVVRFDHRGVGQTDLPEGPYTLETLSEDALALLDHLQIPKAVIVAHAFGGRVAQIFTRDHSDRVRALIICGTGGFHPPKISPEAFKTLRNPDADCTARENASLELFCGSRFRERQPERARQILDEVFSQRNQPGSAKMRGEAVQATPAETYWGKVPDSVPALLLYGTEDRFGTVDNARDLDNRIKNSRLIFFEGAGHFVIREQPEGVLEEISNFLKEQDIWR